MARRLPTKDECRAGIPLALDNAELHLASADALAREGVWGFAVAHLIYAVEETEKARTLGKVALGVSLTDDELPDALYSHRVRHAGARNKSWTSAAVQDFIAELGRRYGKGHPEEPSEYEPAEALPLDWDEKAGPLRERGLYVDVTEEGWSSPSEMPKEEYWQLGPAVTRFLQYTRLAYENEIRGGNGAPR